MTNILLAGELGLWLDKTFATFDMSVFHIIGQHQSELFTTLARIFTAMGAVKYGILIGMLGAVLCFFKRTRKVGLSLVFAMLLGILFTNAILKPIALRIRPYNTLQHDAQFWAYYIGAGQLCESDFSFPSGHTSGAFTIAIPLLLCHATSKKKGAKAICWIFPIFAIVTGLSRIYFMIHYATDVIAGAIVGIIAGIIGYALGNGIYKFMEHRSLNEKYDATKLFKNGIKPAAAVAAITIAWALIFSFTYITSRNDGGPNIIRCAYNGEYNCQNEAQTNSKKYPPIGGKEYCKYHWKQVANGELDPNGNPITEEEITELQTVDPEPIPNSDFFKFLNDQGMTSFCDNFEKNMPVKLVTVWGEDTITTSNEDTIRSFFNGLKGMKVGDKYSKDSGEGVAVTITFVMSDESSIVFEFHNWKDGEEHPSIKWKDQLYEISDTNGVFDLDISE